MSGRRHRYQRAARTQRGVTLVELMMTTAISLLIVTGLSSIINVTVESKAVVEQQNDLNRQASFAMERIVRTLARSPNLVLPYPDKPATNWPENIREETIPASPPIGDSVLATAVLTVLLPRDVDLDFNGIPDADNDADGRFDEDAYGDMNMDGAAGVRGIDDGGDGYVDGVFFGDDDEASGIFDEDPIDGIDNDGDGVIDEDSFMDMNGDGEPGIAGVDDDGDGSIDEGSSWDDDEDGQSDEDWFDTVTFYLQGSTLIERMPVPWDESGNGSVTGYDFVESPIADGLTRLRFERVADSPPDWLLVDITIELTRDNEQTISLNRRVRVGGAL